MPRRSNKTKIGKLFNKAWKVWSLYRRKSAADFQDNVDCFTCYEIKNYKETDLGHYEHGKLDFSPIFTQIQCKRCNGFKHGNLGVYGERLIEKYGLETVNALRIEANQVHKYTVEELQAVIDKYK